MRNGFGFFTTGSCSLLFAKLNTAHTIATKYIKHNLACTQIPSVVTKKYLSSSIKLCRNGYKNDINTYCPNNIVPHYLPLFIFANGPSTSIELWANSGPLKDCWSCIILPMDGSLPKAPPFQYSDWAPAAKNWEGEKTPKNKQINKPKPPSLSLNRANYQP